LLQPSFHQSKRLNIGTCDNKQDSVVIGGLNIINPAFTFMLHLCSKHIIYADTYNNYCFQLEDEGSAEQTKRINFSYPTQPPPPPPLQSQMHMQNMHPVQQQSEGTYYPNMNNMPWRGRGNVRGGQSFGFNNRGAPNMWRPPPRGSVSNQRSFRGGPGSYYRGGNSGSSGGQKGNNQYNNQQSYYGNQGFNGPNSFNNGPFSNQVHWGQEIAYPNQEENCGGSGCSTGSSNKGQVMCHLLKPSLHSCV
jgi:hypothetical protein